MKFPKLIVWGFREIKRPAFPTNDELAARAHAIRLREKLGDPKADRVSKRIPVDFDRGLPIG